MTHSFLMRRVTAFLAKIALAKLENWRLNLNSYQGFVNMVSPSIRLSRYTSLLFAFIALTSMQGTTHAQPTNPDPFRKENLVAWCIVPFDSQKRSPQQRAKMLRELGITKFAYDYRAEHIPTFEQEILALRENGIELTAWWFPQSLNEEAKGILSLLAKYNEKPQLWVMGAGKPNMSAQEESDFMESEVKRLGAIADAANQIGCKVGLYNHGGWFGVPENMVRLVKALNRSNVGIVYNLHHGHDDLDRLQEVVELLKPYLLTLNLNGMETNGDKIGKKILVIGDGERDRQVFDALVRSGYAGPFGVLNHTDEDAKVRLEANLHGLKELSKR